MNFRIANIQPGQNQYTGKNAAVQYLYVSLFDLYSTVIQQYKTSWPKVKCHVAVFKNLTEIMKLYCPYLKIFKAGMLQSFSLLNLVWSIPGVLPRVLMWQAFNLWNQVHQLKPLEINLEKTQETQMKSLSKSLISLNGCNNVTWGNAL